MDILDNYKKAWENQPEENDRVNEAQIYKMAHSRSSSIVKWIFIIGILICLLIVKNPSLENPKFLNINILSPFLAVERWITFS